MSEDNGQKRLFEMEAEEEQRGPVECLGMTFENDEKRREYFLDKLRERLKDPDFRKIEGFPIGEDEDILALSDPPYYTACPNPFIADFVKRYGKPYDPETDNYKREPFAADVSEGKNDPIYNAHSYHTKVPHKAIMRYILHYTEPGDIVFDGFCGTGMTGVAATCCCDQRVIQELGYKITTEGKIKDEVGNVISNPGIRCSVISDLSPIATFIASNLNRPSDVNQFNSSALRIINDVEQECGWMFETIHTQTNEKGKINYIIWSDKLLCPVCGQDFIYWNVAVDYLNKIVLKEFKCPHCGVLLTRQEIERKLESLNDNDLGIIIRRPTQIPILINYSVGRHRFEKEPDQSDLDLISDLDSKQIPYQIPTELMCFKGVNWGDLFRGYHIGTTHVNHFYTKRNMWILSAVLYRIKNEPVQLRNYLLAWFTASQSRLTRLNRYMPNHGRHVGPLSGTYYMSSLPTEISPFYFLKYKIGEFSAIKLPLQKKVFVSTTSATSLNLIESSIDYIFTDPPFGDNLPYSELNFLWESWLRVYTNNNKEAIVSKHQNKELHRYKKLMASCFREYYRILKPGRWITIEFHNSRNSVWNSIQEAIGNAGFIISDIRTLDKQKGTTKQLSYISGAVKQDLIISAYKPNGGLEERFKLEAGTVDGVWDFIRTHLKQLPVFVSKDGRAETIAERQNYLLFDRMVAFHVQRSVTVPLSAAEFYQGLAQRFMERESMYFLEEQIAEYEKKRATVKELMQLELFVKDEESAIQWLKQQLTKKPQTFQELHPQFMKEIGGWQKHEKTLELSLILEQNFLRCDPKEDVPAQVHSYLSSNYKELRNLNKDDPTLRSKAKDRWYVPDPNKAGDLEKLRERSLLKEFAEYLPPGYKTSKYNDDQSFFKGMKPRKTIPKAKRLKTFRLEAVRAGFKRAWQDRDYETIIAVAQRIQLNVLQEDQKLLMWYDQARTRSGID